MIAVSRGDGAILTSSRDIARLDRELVEMTVFLPQRDAEQLERAAHGHCMTIGQMVRHLIRAYTQR
jgi:hypothetical protein